MRPCKSRYTYIDDTKDVVFPAFARSFVGSGS